MENAVMSTGIIDEIESQLQDVRAAKAECAEKRDAFEAMAQVWEATERALAVQLREALDMAGAKSSATAAKAKQMASEYESSAAKQNLLLSAISQ